MDTSQNATEMADVASKSHVVAVSETLTPSPAITPDPISPITPATDPDSTPLITNTCEDSKSLSVIGGADQDSKADTDAIRNAAVAAAQAITIVLQDTSVAKPLTDALTTPNESLKNGTKMDPSSDSSATADLVNQGSSITQQDSIIGSQDASLVSHSLQSAGKRPIEDESDHSDAAKALQQIALSLSGSFTSTDLHSVNGRGGQSQEQPSIESIDNIGKNTSPTSSPIAIFDNTRLSKQDDEANALAQVILSVTRASIEGINVGASEPSNETSAALNHSAPSESESSQGFRFEYNKTTGKSEFKWTAEHTNVMQQALQTIIANGGIPELSSVPTTNGGMLVPTVGQLPVQGSDFGSSSAPASSMAPRKKRKVGGSSKLNTAASIPEGAPSFPCTFEGCEKVFARPYNLKSHLRTHTDVRPFTCSFCQLAFSRNHDLKRHSKIHGGEKLHKCQGCEKSFSRLDALRRHKTNAKKSKEGCQLDPVV
ncbi:hypothetical protein BGZ76_002908 [Entomortierella beljakovae]|nr:hypothetical protein BGZ76_002908 [Entomortierella beljakovae]